MGGRDRANITEFQMAFFNLSHLLIRSLILKQSSSSLLLAGSPLPAAGGGRSLVAVRGPLAVASLVKRRLGTPASGHAAWVQ